MSLPALSSLLKQSHIDDHEEVLRAANTTLKTNKGDLEAQHVKVVALLKLDRFEDAARAVESGAAGLKEKARVDYAYALYKSGRRKEAAEIAHNSAVRGLKHVEVQALYGIEDFARAAELYHGLGADLAGDNEADIRTNSGAVDAQLEWTRQSQHVRHKKPTREDLEAYETAYNAACASIGRGELGQAEVLLKRAKDILHSLQDLSEEEKSVEALPITVQQIYVLTRQGRSQEAHKLADSIGTQSPSDASSKYVTKLNSLVASGVSASPFFIERCLAVQETSLGSEKPFKFQQSIINRNRFAIDLSTSKFDGVISSTRATLAKAAAPSLDEDVNSQSALAAAAHAKLQSGKDGLKHIVPLLERRPDDIGLLFTVVQLHVLTKNSNAAVSILQSFLDRQEKAGTSASLQARYAPAVVGCSVSLYTSQRRTQQVRTELAKAAAYWQDKPDQWEKGVLHLLKTAGAALSESEQDEHRSLAKSVFEALSRIEPQDKYSAAGLLASSDATEQQDTTSLVSLDRLIAGIDVDALETAGIAQRALPATQTQSRKRPATDTPAKKAKKLRQSKMPKDFDPNKKLDPERWLPLRDRSTYRPKGKKGKARQAMLSQGAVMSESENSRPATPGAETLKGKAPVGGGNKKKKKAKK